MSIDMEKVLHYPSLEKAILLSENAGLKNEVTGAMVMEALDVSNWGRPGLILFTSYYAFENISEKELEDFFKKAKEIGIAGFVIKIDRFVDEVPPVFIENCIENDMTLIQIGKQTRYEKIINEILESIINKNAYILKNYYAIHQQFVRLMMTQSTIDEVLKNLENLIHLPVTLIEKVDNIKIGTKESLHEYTVVKKNASAEKHYMNIKYYESTVRYAFSEEEGLIYCIPVPNLGYEEYELIIHVQHKQISDIDLVAIENTVLAIQTELVKKYALSQQRQARLNEMASDLLHGRLNNPEDIKDTIHYLGLKQDMDYNIIIFNFETKKANLTDSIYTRFTDSLINHTKIEFPDRLYVNRKHNLILITPTQSLPAQEMKRKIKSIFNKIFTNNLFDKVNIYTSMSNTIHLNELASGYKQAINAQKILELMNENKKIVTYADLGIYQLFVNTDNLNTLEQFIPQKIWNLKENNTELLHTLNVFLDVNQNYSEASQLLFVHPKTVRYRVDRLKETYQIDFHNSDELLQYSIALRLLKLLPEKFNQGEST
ncbi:PucR family transcriptional regulator [Lacticigenium naphthae]|uniref:PucR family transcriptional regulator n=1 Tax=Lacticigenium naphthae TaxID=515351 RepID=UPI000417D49F|nr:PucR family transcriptional regulator [Lacticigenium naphthae]